MEEKEIIKEIEEKKKFPNKIKEKIMKQTCRGAVSSIIVYVYFIFLNLGIRNIHQDIYVVDLKVFSISLAVLSIILLEKAYNSKDNKKMCIGIEVLTLAIITMLLQYTVIYLTPKYRIMIPIFAVMYNIYFILKTLMIVRKIKKEYKNSFSDIKEIVNDKKK